MHTLPAIKLNRFIPNKYIAITSIAVIITFALFVGMQKLIENDQILRPIVTHTPVIILNHEIKDKPLIVRPKIKPKPIPLPQPKLVAKIIDSDPDTKFDSTLFVSNIGAPVIRSTINPNFSTQGGDARPIVRVEPKYPAPASIKRHVLTKQQDNQGSAYIFRRISYVAVAASTLLLMSLLLTQHSEQVSTELNYQVVQLHTLDTHPDGLSKSIKNRYADHYNDYLAQKKTYAAHHKTQAVLQLTDNGWQLKSCDDEVLKLSNELIAALSNIQQIDTKISSGDAVEIAFDQTGIILGITRSGNYLRC